jgi:hypothetical protein
VFSPASNTRIPWSEKSIKSSNDEDILCREACNEKINATCSPSTCRYMALAVSSGSTESRLLVAQNPSTPYVFLKELANLGNDDINQLLIKNPQFDRDLAAPVAVKTKDPGVLNCVWEYNLSYSDRAQIIQVGSDSILTVVARRETDPDLLSEIYGRSSGLGVLVALVGNSYLPQQTYDTISEGSLEPNKKELVLALASNNRTNIALLEMLSGSQDVDIYMRVGTNTRVLESPCLSEKLLKNHPNDLSLYTDVLPLVNNATIEHLLKQDWFRAKNATADTAFIDGGYYEITDRLEIINQSNFEVGGRGCEIIQIYIFKKNGHNLEVGCEYSRPYQDRYNFATDNYLLPLVLNPGVNPYKADLQSLVGLNLDLVSRRYEK